MSLFVLYQFLNLDIKMKKESGLTLLELLVGLAIFSIIITGLYAVLRSGLYTFKEAEERMAYVETSLISLYFGEIAIVPFWSH